MDNAALREGFAEHLPTLFTFAYLACGDREDARCFIVDLAERFKLQMDDGSAARRDGKLLDALLVLLIGSLDESLGRNAELTFKILDSILQSDVTRPIDLNAKGIDGDPTRIPILLWELKRTCLTRVLSCLPPSVRLSFILTDLLRYSPAGAAKLLNIKESAYRVRLTRARKRVEDYLTPRCQHVERKNNCGCEGRLGIALEAQFVSAPPHTLDTPTRKYNDDPPLHDIVLLFRKLPSVVMAPKEIAAVHAILV
jgi:RNA polymerase sigma-70 factor (ECF subfamily)